MQQYGNDFRPPGQEILDPYSFRYAFFTYFIFFIQLQLQIWRSSFFHSISQYETKPLLDRIFIIIFLCNNPQNSWNKSHRKRRRNNERTPFLQIVFISCHATCSKKKKKATLQNNPIRINQTNQLVVQHCSHSNALEWSHLRAKTNQLWKVDSVSTKI